jgi:hypothetical protein
VQVPNGPIPLSVQLPGVVKAQFLLAEGKFVGQVIKAIISEFKHRFSGIDPDQLLLYKLDGRGSRTSLDPTRTLAEEGIYAGTKLVVELEVPAVAAPATSTFFQFKHFKPGYSADHGARHFLSLSILITRLRRCSGS